MQGRIAEDLRNRGVIVCMSVQRTSITLTFPLSEILP